VKLLSRNNSQDAVGISFVALQTAGASLEDSSGTGEEIQRSEDNNQDGVQQGGNGGGQSGEQDNANTGNEETSPPELTPSPGSKGFLGRGSPPVQDNILNGGGGSNIIARDCPDTGPIPPDCTINPFPLMSGEIQGEATPTPTPTSGLTPTLRAPLQTLNEIPPPPINCKLFPFAPSCKTPTPTPNPTIKAPLPTLIESPPPPINCKLFPFAPSCKTPTPTPTPSPAESPAKADDNPVTAERGLFSPIPQ
jgi:molecular chaperone DnaK